MTLKKKKKDFINHLLELKSFSDEVKGSKNPIEIFKTISDLIDLENPIASIKPSYREKFEKELKLNFSEICTEIYNDLMVRFKSVITNLQDQFVKFVFTKIT